MIQIGFFGKIPTSGDFVARGISLASRQFWDRWMISHLRFAFGPDVIWPKGGLRVSTNGQIGVILPSRDKAGRHFPFLGLVTHDLSEGFQDVWIDAILPFLNRACEGALDASSLDLALKNLDLERIEEGVAPNGSTIWAKGERPITCDIKAPQAALKSLFTEV